MPNHYNCFFFRKQEIIDASLHTFFYSVKMLHLSMLESWFWLCTSIYAPNSSTCDKSHWFVDECLLTCKCSWVSAYVIRIGGIYIYICWVIFYQLGVSVKELLWLLQEVFLVIVSGKQKIEKENRSRFCPVWTCAEAEFLSWFVTIELLWFI